jgi:hypothetical protein
LDSSLFPYHIHTYHFSEKFLTPPAPFQFPIIMAHTRSQDLEARFNTLQSGFLETQKEVKQLNANIASIDSSINATINTTMQSSMEELKQELTTQLESVFASLCTKLKIPTDDHFSEAPPNTEGETFLPFPYLSAPSLST